MSKPLCSQVTIHFLSDKGMSTFERDYQPDPNIGPSSPSGSAMQRLSTYDPPPSNNSTITPNDPSYPLTLSDPIHSIPKDGSEQTSLRASEPEHTHVSKAGSKLSKLGSSRGSSVSTRSESSRSSGTFVTGSIRTFHALRPSAQSERPLSSVTSSKQLSSPSSTPIPSASSSIIQRAIQTALELEAVDREATPKPSQPRTEPSDRSETPTHQPFTIPSSPKTPPVSPTRPLSKLALLAQQKAEGGSRPSTLQRLSTPPQSPPSSRPLSKLAMLAQQKVDATRMPKLPKTSTEYLTPIANGPSVTTAITTSYQSLYSLTDPSRSNVIPKLNVVPLHMSVEAPTPTDHRPSKLAMKIKRASDRSGSVSECPPEEPIMPPPSPLFQSKPYARASPSAFASVLILDNLHNHQDKNMTKGDHGDHKHKKEVLARKTIRDGSTDNHSHKLKHTNSLSHDPTPFAFNVPSPDDIVLNARKGSTFKDVASASPKATAGAGKSSSKS